jgi:broad specificity phosphatase PhoE
MLILVRHGQSESNARGVLVGRSDVSLTELGVAQARRTGEFLASERAGAVDGEPRAVHLITSPLRRTRSTADAIAAALGGSITPVVEERLIELDYGELEGRRPGEVDRAMWAAWRADPSWTPPGGESFEQLHARLDPLWLSLSDDATTGDVIAVSHVSPIKACVAWALGGGPELAWRLSLGVCAITRVRTGSSSPALVSFGETGHLLGVQ